MAPSRSKEILRQVVGLTSCAIACLSATALTAVVTLFATSRPAKSFIHGPALAAAVFNVIALGTLLCFIILQTWTPNHVIVWARRHKWRLAPLVILPWLVAVISSLYVLVWMQTHMGLLLSRAHHRHVRELVVAAFVMWAISLITHAIFLSLYYFQGGSPRVPFSTPTSISGTTPESGAQKRSHELTLRVLAPPPFAMSSLPSSPTRSPGSLSPMSSARNSINQFLRPMGSKTRLIHKPSWGSGLRMSIQSDRPISVDTRQEDGFETWEVDSDHEEIVSPSRRPARLEPIPGSRPVSPARPLDGPFPDPEDLPMPEELPLPESPAPSAPQSPVVASPSSPPGSSPTTRSFPSPMARRPSNNGDQSHIHPLFRTDSPTPPPAASPGTIVTASPYGGQIMTDDPNHPLRRMHSSNGSRPGSPVVLSPTRSRPGSSRSSRHPLQNSLSEGDGSENEEEAPPLPGLENLQEWRRGVE